jgi:putative GTP pyrophosphokinase
MAVSAPLTTSAINRAGRLIREALHGRRPPTSPEVERAVDVLIDFRAAHEYPLVKANMGLRSVVRSTGCKVEVSQRLKRARTILDKLAREPTMQLANMQDIGGCRAVLASIAEVRAVEQRLTKNRHPRKVYDYIVTPRPSGYRGVHVVVTYEDERHVSRQIEVQLRTKTMHEWAIAVERLSGRMGQDLKSDRGPTEVLELLAAISKAMAIEERGAIVPADLVDEMTKLRAAALPFMGATNT